MVEVRIKDDESFEALLRRFSKKVQQESIVSEARRRQNFESPTSIRKKKISNKYVTIFFGHLENKKNNKLNISFVAKKKIGNAVKRNKIKRRLRNIINQAVKEISIKFDFSYLVIAKSTMLNNEFKIIKETLFQEFKKIK